MAIKAVGVVTGNPGDGRHLTVDWTPVKPRREWYFYTHLSTVWRVVPRDYASRSLIDFAFEGKDQDIERLPSELPRSVEDRFADDTSGRLRDICPFTIMGTFNRGLTDDNRIKIARELAGILGMEELDGHLLRSLAGIPTLDNRNSWFFPYERERDDDHIDALWQVCADALQYADDSDETNRASLIHSFNDAVSRKGVGRMLTVGLYWIRPHAFVSLDRSARAFIEEQLGVDVPKGKPDGETYLNLCEELQLMFNDEKSPVHSFPHLSAMAWDGCRC